MSAYTVHYDWGHWREKTSFLTRETCVRWLRNGFQPKECKITVEYEGETHVWDCDAPYAKKNRSAPLKPETKKLIAEQKADNISAANHLKHCRQLRERKSV